MHGVSGFGDASDEMSQEDDMPQTKWITESSQEDDMPRGCQHVSAQNPWPSNKETGRTSAGIIRAARRNVISGGSFGDVYIYIYMYTCMIMNHIECHRMSRKRLLAKAY